MHDEYVPAPPEIVPADGFAIEFPDEGKREAGTLAKDLKLALDNAAADEGAVVTVTVKKVNPNAQDPGTILAVILAAKATVALATGLALWMRRKNQGRIRIRFPDGTSLDVSGVESQDIPRTVQAIESKK